MLFVLRTLAGPMNSSFASSIALDCSSDRRRVVEILLLFGYWTPLTALRDQAGTSGSDFCDGLSLAWFSSGCQKDAEAVVVEVAEASR